MSPGSSCVGCISISIFRLGFWTPRPKRAATEKQQRKTTKEQQDSLLRCAGAVLPCSSLEWCRVLLSLPFLVALPLSPPPSEGCFAPCFLRRSPAGRRCLPFLSLWSAEGSGEWGCFPNCYFGLVLLSPMSGEVSPFLLLGRSAFLSLIWYTSREIFREIKGKTKTLQLFCLKTFRQQMERNTRTQKEKHKKNKAT